MKGYRFYLEHESAMDKRAGKHTGNCFAVLLGKDGRPLRQSDPAMVEGIGAVYGWPDSACAGTSASYDYLRKRCKRVSERKVREVHPKLFIILDKYASHG
jgi:hypothetical protein